jgi:hypothetical protein
MKLCHLVSDVDGYYMTEVHYYQTAEPVNLTDAGVRPFLLWGNKDKDADRKL